MTYYTFSQNNSGGDFDFDEGAGIAQYVVVEAATKQGALDRWFSVVEYPSRSGDCECCGDRWGYDCYDEGEVPTLYDRPLEESTGYGLKSGDVLAFVHRLDATIEKVLVR